MLVRASSRACGADAVVRRVAVAFLSSAFAQQTGAVSGKVVDSGGGVLPGVTVEARAGVLPTPRVGDDRRQRRLSAAGAAARRLHAHVRALRHADR